MSKLLDDLLAEHPVTPVPIETSHVPNTMIRVLDLFAGAGGLSTGAALAGTLVLAGIEWNPAAVATARRAGHNFHDMEVSELALDHGGIEEALIGVDLLIGGPPCQPFSTQGERRGHYDPRDGFPVALDVIDNLSPARVVLENVEGLLGPKYEAYREQILADLRKRYRRAGIWQLNAMAYGVPQDRARVFVWAAEQDLAPPVPTHGPGTRHPFVGVRDVLPELGPAILTRNNTAKSRSTALPSPTVTTKRTLYTAYKPNLVYRTGPARYFDRDLGRDVPIPKTERLLTPAETLVLMGFPRDYPFKGSLEEQARQIGNAVPPPLARAVIQAATAGWTSMFLPAEKAHAFMKRHNRDGTFLERDLFDRAILGVSNTIPRSKGRPLYVYGYNRMRDVCIKYLEEIYKTEIATTRGRELDELHERIFSEGVEYADSLRDYGSDPNQYEILGEGDIGLVEGMGGSYEERVYSW